MGLGCNKEISDFEEVIDINPTYNKYYQILTFVESIEGKSLTHPSIQQRTGYSVNDILDYVEGGMNLMYTDPNLTWRSYATKTDTFSIPLNAGYASYQDLTELFQEVTDSASTHFYSISEYDKFPFLFDAIMLVSSSQSNMDLSFTSKVGISHRDPTPFGETDYWNVYIGKCGPYSGGTENASDIMNYALNDYYAPYAYVFYTDVTNPSYEDLIYNGWEQLNPNDPNPGDFIIDYRTFVFFCWDYQTYGNPEEWSCSIENGYPDCAEYNTTEITCLDPDEMNYYFGSIRQIYEDYLNNANNPNLTHMVSEIYLQGSLCLNVAMWWWPDVTFGQANPIDVEPEDYPKALTLCCP